jgi:hypothetical protein
MNRWQPSFPEDWSLIEYLQRELPALYCYEFSRESQALRDSVEFVRHGKITELTYWQPCPEFGWAEWPAQSYLSIPQAERLERLNALTLRNEKILELFPKPIVKTPARPRHTGRASDEARYHDQLRSLSVARLRVNFSAAEALELLSRTNGRALYSDTTALERAKRKAHRFLIGFILRAETQIAHGLWFPPFGNHIVKP